MPGNGRLRRVHRSGRQRIRPLRGAATLKPGERALVLGGTLTGLASLIHVAIIFGGADWYRFFGAGERMARLAASGSLYPTIVTAFIAIVLGIWTFYAFSGAGLIHRLPFLRVALVLIAAVYLMRGILGIPAILIVDDPYSRQLRARMTFMIASSIICLFLGFCYAVGAWTVWRRTLVGSALAGVER